MNFVLPPPPKPEAGSDLADPKERRKERKKNRGSAAARAFSSRCGADARMRESVTHIRLLPCSIRWWMDGVQQQRGRDTICCGKRKEASYVSLQS